MLPALRPTILVFAALSPFVVIEALGLEGYSNSRQELAVSRRIYAPANSTTVAKKSRYIKHAISHYANTPEEIANLSPADVALQMNHLEREYKLPYSWGGSITSRHSGLDCSGFFHGIFYYLGYDGYKKRFTTRSLFWKLQRDKNYELVFDANHDGLTPPPGSTLVKGDIILWPSGIRDGRNIPGPIFGHVGMVTAMIDGKPVVTHSVRSDAYDPHDVIGLAGNGINTMDAELFMSLKQRGRLTVFRKVRSPITEL